MAADENNEQYMAEAWISNEKEEEYKASYLYNLLNQLQGHKDDSSGLNADKLDGYHYYQIENLVEQSVEEFIKEIQIGPIHFDKSNINSFIPFEAIHLSVPGMQSLYTNMHGDPGDEDYYDNSDKLDLSWIDNYSPTEREYPNLIDVFYQLHEMVEDKCTNDRAQAIEDNVAILQEFKSRLDESGVIEVDSEGHSYINANSINGVRLFVVSQKQYDEYKETEAGRKCINNLQNLFFIKPTEEVEAYVDANGNHPYEDGYLPTKADTAPISNYYQFRVADYTSSSANPDVITDGQEFSAGRYLQYRYYNVNQWRIMCLANDLVDETALGENLINIIQDREDYLINPVSLDNSLSEYENSHDYLKNKYISGAYYTESSTRHDFESSPDGNRYRFLNLTPLFTKLNNLIDSNKTTLNNKINTLEKKTIGSVSTSLASKLEKLTGRVTTAESNITNLNSRANTTDGLIWDSDNSIITRLNRIEGYGSSYANNLTSDRAWQNWANYNGFPTKTEGSWWTVKNGFVTICFRFTIKLKSNEYYPSGTTFGTAPYNPIGFTTAVVKVSGIYNGVGSIDISDQNGQTRYYGPELWDGSGVWGIVTYPHK